MRKVLPTLFIVLLITLAVPALSLAAGQDKEPSKAVNISGVWSMTITAPQGEQTNDVTFAQDKETLKVTMTGPNGMTLEGPGTVKDGAADWAVSIETPNGTFTIMFKAKIDGDKMEGLAAMGDFGSMPFTAVKKK